MSLTKHINDLADILFRNVELYEEMAGQLEEERLAFQSHSIDNLDKNLKQKETIILKIKALEETRQRVMSALGKAARLDPKQLTFSRLLELAADPLKDRLSAIRQSLREKIEKTNELNSFNRGLIERLIRINYDAAAHLQNLLEPEETYARQGMAASPLKAGRVVEQTF